VKLHLIISLKLNGCPSSPDGNSRVVALSAQKDSRIFHRDGQKLEIYSLRAPSALLPASNCVRADVQKRRKKHLTRIQREANRANVPRLQLSRMQGNLSDAKIFFAALLGRQRIPKRLPQIVEHLHFNFLGHRLILAGPVLLPVPLLDEWTGHNLGTECYANLGFMRRKLEFGAGAVVSNCLSSSASATLQIPSRLITDRASKINAFLIDTLAIRIIFNSFACNIRARSNRHSSASLKLHKNWADFTSRGKKIGVTQTYFREGMGLNWERSNSRSLVCQESASVGMTTRKLNAGKLEAGAGGAEIFAQGCYVRAVRADAAGIHGEAEALGLLDAQARVVKFGEAVAFSRQHAVAPCEVHRSRRPMQVVPLSNYVEELVPVTTVPHTSLPKLPIHPIGCSIGKIGGNEFHVSRPTLARRLFRQLESVILTPALEKVAASTANVSIKLLAVWSPITDRCTPDREIQVPSACAGLRNAGVSPALFSNSVQATRDERHPVRRTLHELPCGCYTFRKLRPEPSATESAKAGTETRLRALTVHVSSEKSQ
jgi:hypothetical protein